MVRKLPLRASARHERRRQNREHAKGSDVPEQRADVRPPAIELANRDIIEAHLHAVWLAETGKELSPDIPHVLGLSAASLPVQEETEFGITLAAPP